jgi:rubrerythrin
MSNPVKPTNVGKNRTGAATSPLDSKDIAAVAETATTWPDPDGRELLAVRVAASQEAEPLGTMPPPASLKGAAKSTLDAIKGHHPLAFLDLLGERLAFERTGTRLYDALLAKFEASHAGDGGPTRDELEEIRDDELAHFVLLKDALERLGADPTAVTPSADAAAVMSMGLVQLVSDPRVTLTEALKAILTAELTDNDCWLVLSDVAERLGHADLAAEFRDALATEETHLARVRSWVTAAIDAQAGLTMASGSASVTDGGAAARDE